MAILVKNSPILFDRCEEFLSKYLFIKHQNSQNSQIEP